MQIWLQNMQDLGVCEEVGSCLYDVKIPDVDATFRNFEEVFGDDKNKHPLFGKMDATRVEVIIHSFLYLRTFEFAF